MERCDRCDMERSIDPHRQRSAIGRLRDWIFNQHGVRRLYRESLEAERQAREEMKR